MLGRNSLFEGRLFGYESEVEVLKNSRYDLLIFFFELLHFLFLFDPVTTLHD